MATNLAMPLLVMNMGGEMMYVLEQRLEAQNIPKDKSERVLQDVISALFAPRFIDELFRPEKTYSSSVTRQIFDRLAHSSIMRLNSTSMDKLYDLMTMGVKYQILAASHPYEMLQSTLNHIDSVRDMVLNAPDVVKLIESTRQRITSVFASHSLGQLQSVRQALLRFFMDRRVKVSILLQDGIQLPSGAFAVQTAGVAPVGTEPSGAIRYFSLPDYSTSALKSLSGRADVPEMAGQQKLTPNVTRSEYVPNMPNARDVVPLSEEPLPNILLENRPSKLGLNAYAVSRKEDPTATRATPATASPSTSSAPNTPGKAGSTNTRLVTNELDSLAALIGGSIKKMHTTRAHARELGEADQADFNRQSEEDRAAMESSAGGSGVGVLTAMTQQSGDGSSKQGLGSFLLSSLFENEEDDDGTGVAAEAKDAKSANTIIIRRIDRNQQYAKLASSIALTESKTTKNEQSNPEDTVDDLLALMDMASGHGDE